MPNIDTFNNFFKHDNEILFSKELELSSSKSTAIELLSKKNPLYDTFEPEWSFYLDSYEGGSNFVSTANIFKHVRETNEDYNDRVHRAVYLNYVQPLVNFFSNFIFSEEISRDGGTHNELYQKFILNVNGKGDSIDLFMRDVCDLNQIYGHVDILVDKRSNETGEELSRAQEEALGLDNPYLVIMYPSEVLDWSFSDTGNFTYLKRCVVDGPYKHYTIWYPDKIYKIVTKESGNKDSIEDKVVIPNTIGEVPVVRSYYRRSKKYKDMGTSFLADIAYISRKIMNVSSLLDEFLYRQCVTGDTLIECPRDLEKYPYGIPIKELVGKEFPTYSWDIENQKYVIRKAYDVRKTGEKQPVYRLKFVYKDEYNQDKEGHLDATGNHPILLQNGEYVDLKDLKKDDKLVPFHKEKANHKVVSVEFLGYEDVYNFEVEEHHNYVANSIVVHNCYNFLAKETDASIPFKDQVEGNMGTSNVFEVPRGAQFPQYISPPVDPAQFLQSEREKNVLEIYRIAAQDTAVEIFTGQSKSGDAQNQSFHKTIPYISSRAENLEKSELEIARLWLKWVDSSAVWNGSIKYKDDYSMQNLTSLLIQAKMLFSDIKVPSTTFIKNEMLRLISQFDGKMNSDDIRSIKEEIDKNVTDDYVQKMYTAKPGANNLKGISSVPANSAQMKQGEVQKTLGDNVKISGLGADNVS